jgi:hypothetical protein
LFEFTELVVGLLRTACVLATLTTNVSALAAARASHGAARAALTGLPTATANKKGRANFLMITAIGFHPLFSVTEGQSAGPETVSAAIEAGQTRLFLMLVGIIGGSSSSRTCPCSTHLNNQCDGIYILKGPATRNSERFGNS